MNVKKPKAQRKSNSLITGPSDGKQEEIDILFKREANGEEMVKKYKSKTMPPIKNDFPKSVPIEIESIHTESNPTSSPKDSTKNNQSEMPERNTFGQINTEDKRRRYS